MHCLTNRKAWEKFRISFHELLFAIGEPFTIRLERKNKEKTMDIMGVLAVLVQLVNVVFSIISLVCLIIVIVKFFQSGDSGTGVLCLLTTIFCGIGALITFILGWIKAGELGLKKVMLIWSVCIVINIGLGLLIFLLGLGSAAMQSQ